MTAIMPQKVTHRLVAMEIYNKRTGCTNAGWGFFSASIGFWISYFTVASMRSPLSLAACILLTALSVWNFLKATIADAEMQQGTMEVDAALLLRAARTFAVASEDDTATLPLHVNARLYIGRKLRLTPRKPSP